jgi:hypothetical protein
VPLLTLLEGKLPDALVTIVPDGEPDVAFRNWVVESAHDNPNGTPDVQFKVSGLYSDAHRSCSRHRDLERIGRLIAAASAGFLGTVQRGTSRDR